MLRIKMDCDDEVFKWLEHALSLKTERGLRNSIDRLINSIIDEEITRRNRAKLVITYQQTELAWLLSTMRGISLSKTPD